MHCPLAKTNSVRLIKASALEFVSFEIISTTKIRNGKGMDHTQNRIALRLRTTWPVVEHSARTAVAAIASLLVARLFGLPEAYWATVTTLVIAQSSLGAALGISWERFVGTAIGALVGGVAATYFAPHALTFGVSVFVLGLLCALARSDQGAYRFGSVTLAIVLLIPRTGSPWKFAFHRFAEVSIGIGVALILSWAWPEKVTPSR